MVIRIKNNHTVSIEGIKPETKAVTFYFSYGQALSAFEGEEAFPGTQKRYKPFRDFTFPVVNGEIKSLLLVSFLKLAGAEKEESLKFLKDMNDGTYLCTEDIDISPVSEILSWAQGTTEAIIVDIIVDILNDN